MAKSIEKTSAEKKTEKKTTKKLKFIFSVPTNVHTMENNFPDEY